MKGKTTQQGRARGIARNQKAGLRCGTMNAAEYRSQHTPAQLRALAKAAGTTDVYLLQICRGIRRPSPEMAMRLVEASGGALDFQSLMLAPVKSRAAKE